MQCRSSLGWCPCMHLPALLYVQRYWKRWASLQGLPYLTSLPCALSPVLNKHSVLFPSPSMLLLYVVPLPSLCLTASTWPSSLLLIPDSFPPLSAPPVPLLWATPSPSPPNGTAPWAALCCFHWLPESILLFYDADKKKRQGLSHQGAETRTSHTDQYNFVDSTYFPIYCPLHPVLHLCCKLTILLFWNRASSDGIHTLGWGPKGFL